MKVLVKRCPSYNAVDITLTVNAIFEHFGGVAGVLKNGQNILIKPNLLMAREPGTATTTNPEIVAAVATLLVQAGANVVIADSPGGPYTNGALKKVYASCGMGRAAQQSGASLNFDIGSATVKYAGLEDRSFEIINPAFKADTIINIAKAKTHMLTYYTGAVKNMFGTIAGLNKAACHARLPQAADFCRLLVDLCNYNAPSINIIDCVEGMDGKGPSGGRVRQVGVVLASENPYWADLAMMDIVGLDHNRSPIHKIAVEQGLAPKNPWDLELVGDPVPSVNPPFVPAATVSVFVGAIRFLPKPVSRVLESIFMRYPKISRRCVGCADCARACPKGAITVIRGKAELDRSKCIKCYCCHELCPIKAVDL